MQVVADNRPQVRHDRLLRMPEVETITGIRKTTIYHLMKRGEFPRCVQITPRCVAWAESLVRAWVQERIAASAAAQPAAQRDLPDTPAA